MMTASDILATVPPSVQLTLLGIGAIYLAKKALDVLPLLSSLVLGGTNVRASTCRNSPAKMQLPGSFSIALRLLNG